MADKLSLIIITCGRAELLRQTLTSLCSQSRQADEVIVVDNGPDAHTEAAVLSHQRVLPVKYVVEHRRGYGSARNAGLRAATGDLLLFIDDDCLPDPRWAETLVAALKTGEAELAGGSRTCIREGLPAFVDYLSSDAPVLHPQLQRGLVSHLSTSNLIVGRRTALTVGLFDEAYSTCEDRDFCARARQLGFRLLYEPQAVVHHQPPIFDWSHYFRKMMRYGSGTTEYFARHRASERLAFLFPESPTLRLLLLPVLAVLGTGYLVLRNWPQQPQAILLSPLLFAGQVAWHWGGFQAARHQQSTVREARAC